MASRDNIPADLYKIAMALFFDAGHAATAVPMSINHSPEQVVYLDSKVDVYLSRQQRTILNEIANISHLFDISDSCFNVKDDKTCGFYSIELMTVCSSRSQTAYDAHIALIPFLSGDINIILFRHDDKLMLSMQGFDSDVVLSDWYDEITEIDQLTEQIDIGNISLNSARDYISDFIYSCARWYYIYPISGEQAAYDMLPLDCFFSTNLEAQSYSKDELKEIARDAFRTAEKEYGDDFVDSGISNNVSSIDISAELDLLSLEIDMDEEIEESPFGEENDFEDDPFEDEEYGDEEQEKDEYKFDDYDENIFRDPLQMLKLLEANDKRTRETDLRPFPQRASSTTTIGTDLASFFKEFDLEVIDKRPKGGCLWVVGDEQTLKEYILLAEQKFGVVGDYAMSKAIGGRTGWYTKSNK